MQLNLSAAHSTQLCKKTLEEALKRKEESGYPSSAERVVSELIVVIPASREVSDSPVVPFILWVLALVHQGR